NDPDDLVPIFTIAGKFKGKFTYSTKVEVNLMSDYLYGFHVEGCPFESSPYEQTIVLI
ncbi:911_t:CDS:1, partial [Gigaspora rosea]